MRSILPINRMPLHAMVLLALLSSLGCSRHFWRTQADFDTYNLLQKKQTDPRWSIPRSTVDPDPRSRFYDPFDPDCEPLPPDDPAASEYMRMVHGMRGYKSWHELGESMSVENPEWLANFGLSPEKPYSNYDLSDGLTTLTQAALEENTDPPRMVPALENMTLAQAIELANINSRDYQTQIENAFLSALQLTFEQFKFNVRYLYTPGVAGTEPAGVASFRNPASSRNNIGFGSTAGISQILPTGGQWVVELANNTVWLFSAGNRSRSASVLSYSITQPLLSRAGRKIALEELTQSEREALYDMRTLARYRKIFFSDTVAAGVGGGTAGGGATTISGTSVLGTTVSAAGVGYLGLLQQAQQIRNQRENIQGLYVQTERQRALISQTPYRRLKPGAIPEGFQFPEDLTSKIVYQNGIQRLWWSSSEPMTAAERDRLLSLIDDEDYRQAVLGLFDQLRTGVITADMLQLATQLTAQENTLRTQERAFGDAVDRYKIFLGLPTDMQVTLDQSLLQQFELIAPELGQLEIEVLEFADVSASINDEDPKAEELRSASKQLGNLIESIRTSGLELVTEDFAKVAANTPLRLSKLKFDRSKELVEFALERDRVIFRTIKSAFEQAMERHTQLALELSKENLSQKERRISLIAMRDIREELFTIVQNLRVVQVGLRAELINLPDFDMSQEDAVAIALDNRLDLMNQRGRVMDARRAVEVTANRLEAVLNLVAQGDIATRSVADPKNNANPLDFQGAQSSFSFGVQVTAPIDQVAERNAYRAVLMSYQRARRDYMRLEDQVKFEVRTDWRQLNVARLNFETTRKNLRQAALQLDIVVANANDPSRQQVGRAGTTASTGNTGLNLLNALNAVLRAQNDLVQSWVDYERSRINIHRDMDTMVIDERGLWVDPVYQGLLNDSSPRLNTPAEPSEPANVQPNESAAFVRPVKRAELNSYDSSGIVRLTSGARAFEQEQSLDQAVDRALSTDWRFHWRNHLLADLAGDVESAKVRDGRSRFGDSEANLVSDPGDGAGNARLNEERFTAE